MEAALHEALEGKIDFEGQKLAERISRDGLVASTVIAFIIGFATQSLRSTFITLGFTTALLALITIPPWPMYNRNPVKWQPVKEKKSESKKRK